MSNHQPEVRPAIVQACAEELIRLAREIAVQTASDEVVQVEVAEPTLVAFLKDRVPHATETEILAAMEIALECTIGPDDPLGESDEVEEIPVTIIRQTRH